MADREAALVGVAIPAFRAADTLAETLRSCVRQTHGDWVAWVTVDGESDEVERSIVAGLGDPRIHVVANGRRLGQFANFNRAIAACLAEGAGWIKTLCADDVLHDDALARLVRLGRSDLACGLVYGYYNGIDGRGRPLFDALADEIEDQVIDGPAFLRETLGASLFNVIGGPSSVLIRSEILERYGMFDESFTYSGDVALWHRLASRVKVGVVGRSPILDYRCHDDSVTGRGKMTVAAFKEPLDIARGLASESRPFGSDWLRAQWIRGEIAASNTVTALALARRGQVTASARGMAATLRRLEPVSALSAVLQLPTKLVRLATGGAPRPHPLVPRLVHRAAADAPGRR